MNDMCNIHNVLLRKGKYCPVCGGHATRQTMPNSKRGQVSFFLNFLILAIIIGLITAIIIPFGTLFTMEAYKGGELIWNLTEPRITGIQDTAVRNSVYSAVQEAKDATDTTINMQTDIYKYSWVILLVVLSLVAFLFTRKNVEVGGGVV